MRFARLVPILGAGLILGAAGDTTPSTTRPALFKDSRQSLAIAQAQGRTHVSLLIAAKPGASRQVAAQAKRLGGDVRYEDAEVGYLRVKIPIGQAVALSESASIEAVTVDYDDAYPSRLRPGADALPLASPDPAWPPKLSEYPLTNPYSPVADLAADGFLAEHPTWDGRGVTIAVLDGNLDVLLPEFQTGRLLDGSTVPKMADYLNVTDPRDDFELNPQWVDMKEVVRSSGGTITFGGKTLRVPRAGTYRVGFFSERRFNSDSNASYMDQDIDRNGNPRGDDGLFAVLWDESSNDVWVDTDRDLDLSNEKELTDYARRPVFGVFGKDDPETPWRDTVAFAVQTDRKNKFVSINVAIYQHCTTIMGSVVGNRENGGRIQGVAPGARMVSIFYGVSNAHGLIEGLIAAFRHPQVDLIVLEQSVAIASLSYLLADATHPISVIAQRLTERYGKLMFVPADNTPAFGFVAEDGLAPGAMSVGGYQSKESYRVNNGFLPERDDNLHWGALSHGPSANGGLKPDLLAPSGQIGTEVGYRKGAGQKGLYVLPPGYSVDGGTSTAAPMAAGAAALVVSAAKQTGVPYDAARLKAALTGAARFIPNLAANEQGNGLIQVGPAYETLRKLQPAPPLKIAVRAPVRTKLSPLLRPPNEGIGIYEREGWKTGDRGDRTITFTRESGPPEPMTFSLTWIGNDGTFSSADSVTLPLGRSVALPVAIAAEKEGPHSAILSLDHPMVPGHAKRVLNTIVVPHRFSAENKYEIKATVTPALPGDVGVFVEVPPGVDALKIEAASQEVGLSLVGPDRDLLYPCPFEPRGQANACAIAFPQPGVWEINVGNNRVARNFDPEASAPVKSAPVAVTAAIFGVGVRVDSGAGAADGAPVPIALENRLAPVSSAAAASELASVRRQSVTLAPGERRLTEIAVPKGTTSLVARVQGVSDPEADIDVYLLNCSEPEKPAPDPKEDPAKKDEEKDKGNKSPAAPAALCGAASKAADVGPGGLVRVVDPRPGRWVVAVDAFRARGPVTFELVDVYTHPALGAVAVLDAPADRPAAQQWTAQARPWPAAPNADANPGRHVEALVFARSGAVTSFSGLYGQGDKIPIPLGTPGAAIAPVK